MTIQTEDGPVLKSRAILYENLSETFAMFNQENPDLKEKVGLRKFAEFRPQHIVFQAEKASMRLCLCRYCSNPKRMIQSSVLGKKEFRSLVPGCPDNQPVKPINFVEHILCSEPTMACWMRTCGLCKSKIYDLEEDLKLLCEEQKIEMCHYEVWENTDRTNVVEKTVHYSEFASTFCQMIEKLSSHTFEHKEQTAFYERLRQNVPENHCVAAGDFAENFEFFEACMRIFFQIIVKP